MSPPRSKFRRAAGLLLSLAAWGIPSRARAQACCAGGSVVTPGRLELHENVLAGVQVHAANIIGSYDVTGRYLAAPPGSTELDFEEDLFAAARVLGRGQVTRLVPLVETRRANPPALGGAHLGGGIGDVNASARYDFVRAGESAYVPGVALLAGLTAPTGTSPEQATQPLAVDATGIGAWQVNVALALEQTYGPWLINATGIVAERTPRYGQTLGTQVTFLLAGAYTFPDDAAVALSASYAFEGDATAGSADVPDSSKRLTVFTLSGLYPVTDTWRVLGGLFLDPPAGHLGSNQARGHGTHADNDQLMVLRRSLVHLAMALACESCAITGTVANLQVPGTPLVGARGERLDAREIAGEADLTVFVFFSPDCHCLARHEPRLLGLYETFGPRGVHFFMIDSEVRGSVERDAEEARRRGYPFPVVLDRGARLANALRAEYASYSVVVDRSGRIRYRGGIDSDRQHLHEDATPYVKDALDDLLAGREPRLASGEALGCALQKW